MTMLKDYLKKQELTIIAARPAMGKTTFALRLASELCNEQQSVLYCSLEMDEDQLAQRHYDNRIVVDDTPRQSVEHIRTTIQKNRKNSFPVSIVIIDYLQLMNAGCKYIDRAEELYHILLDLKKLAEKEDVSVIATSHLDRKAELRENHRPRIEDLVFYDGWKDIVDNAVFLYRPEYYRIDTDDLGETKNRMEIIVAHSHKNPCRTFLYNFATPIVKQAINRYTMNIKDLLQDDALKALEDQIIMSFEGCWSKDHDYTDERSLIEVRKCIINHRVLQHQDLLLPDIIAFNDAMREALREMFDKAHAVYEANKGFGEDVEVEACCYLSNDYPALHPVQGEDRQDLWNALQDSGWNLLYEGGVAFPLQLRGNGDPNSNDFEEFIGMKCPPPNWNEGLDQELTKDLHLIDAFHNLFDHTDFAITDFIYCREFYYEIKFEFRNEAQQSH